MLTGIAGGVISIANVVTIQGYILLYFEVAISSTCWENLENSSFFTAEAAAAAENDDSIMRNAYASVSHNHFSRRHI